MRQHDRNCVIDVRRCTCSLSEDCLHNNLAVLISDMGQGEMMGEEFLVVESWTQKFCADCGEEVQG